MKGRELRLRFANGSSLRVPTNDGFYLYRVPDERLIRTQPRAWLLWGRAGPRFASLELRYQDGRRVPLARRSGFFLYVVPGDERVRGHRPAVLTGRAPGGRTLRRELLLAFAWASSL